MPDVEVSDYQLSTVHVLVRENTTKLITARYEYGTRIHRGPGGRASTLSFDLKRERFPVCCFKRIGRYLPYLIELILRNQALRDPLQMN